VKFEKRAGDFAVASVGVQIGLEGDGVVERLDVGGQARLRGSDGRQQQEGEDAHGRKL